MKMKNESVKEKPILFSGEMVRAILDGRKTQTRRVVKDVDPVEDLKFGSTDGTRQRRVCSGAYGPWVTCPYGKPEERLWVRETCMLHANGAGARINYRADQEEIQLAFDDIPDDAPIADDSRWRPSIHMPRWASRLTLEIVQLRVERLQDISDEDAMAEGIQKFTKDGQLKKFWFCDPCDGEFHCPWRELPRTAKAAYLALWESINGRGSWEKNPWVWVVEFRRLQ